MYSKGASSVISRQPAATSSGNMLEMQNCSPPHTHAKERVEEGAHRLCPLGGL